MRTLSSAVRRKMSVNDGRKPNDLYYNLTFKTRLQRIWLFVYYFREAWVCSLDGLKRASHTGESVGSNPTRPTKFLGDVAQLGERCFRTAKVAGSTPVISTNFVPCMVCTKFQPFCGDVAELVQASA